MVKGEAKNGKIYTQIKAESEYPVVEELGNVIAELLAEFQVELINRGNSREKVDAAFHEIMSVISAQNRDRVDSKLIKNSNGYLQ